MSQPAGDDVAQVRTAMIAALGDSGEASAPLARVCEACVELLPVDGASVSMISGTEHRETLYATDATIAAVEDLQFTLGEGPCFDAFTYRRPVLVTDLARDSATAWPVYAAEISTYPVAAIFAFPLQSGAATFGAMDLYRREPGWLTPGELSTALQLVDLATTALLLGLMPTALDHAEFSTVPNRREVVHQAVGMLMAAHRIPTTHALDRLRGYAFASGAAVEQVAADLTSRRIRPADLDA
jgi:hypothetical protein